MPRDFCSYWRALVIIVVVLLIFGSIGGYIVIGTLHAIGAFLGFYAFADWTAPAFGVVLLFIGFAALISVVHGATVLYQRVAEIESHTSRPPSMLKVKYKSWKEKYCPSIEYK